MQHFFVSSGKVPLFTQDPPAADEKTGAVAAEGAMHQHSFIVLGSASHKVYVLVDDLFRWRRVYQRDMHVFDGEFIQMLVNSIDCIVAQFTAKVDDSTDAMIDKLLVLRQQRLGASKEVRGNLMKMVDCCCCCCLLGHDGTPGWSLPLLYAHQLGLHSRDTEITIGKIKITELIA